MGFANQSEFRLPDRHRVEYCGRPGNDFRPVSSDHSHLSPWRRFSGQKIEPLRSRDTPYGHRNLRVLLCATILIIGALPSCRLPYWGRLPNTLGPSPWGLTRGLAHEPCEVLIRIPEMYKLLKGVRHDKYRMLSKTTRENAVPYERSPRRKKIQSIA